MKSGKRIFKAVVAAKDKPKRVRRLGNGGLRSLIIHACRPPIIGTEIGEEVLATAMCVLTERFIARGKEVL